MYRGGGGERDCNLQTAYNYTTDIIGFKSVLVLQVTEVSKLFGTDGTGQIGTDELVRQLQTVNV